MTRNQEISRRRAIQVSTGMMGLESLLAKGLFAANEMPAATLHRLADLAWQPLKSGFFPPGLKVKALFEDKAKNTSLSVVRYPKGYHEPRHTHKGCGHWIYVLTGRVKAPETAYAPGTFIYAPPGDIHGPFVAEEQTDVLFFVDGPFDVSGA